MSHNKSKVPLTSINPNASRNLLKNKARFKNSGSIQTDTIVKLNEQTVPTISVGTINTIPQIQENRMTTEHKSVEKETMPQPKLPEMAEQIILKEEPAVESDLTSINEPLIEEGVQSLEG